jgi:hypothetical protein
VSLLQNNAHDCVISSKGSSVIKFRDVTSRLANVTLRVSGEGANWIHCLVIEGGNVTIDCCELTCGAWGMCVSNKSQVHICGCHVHDNTGCGITVYGGSKMTITVTTNPKPKSLNPKHEQYETLNPKRFRGGFELAITTAFKPWVE